MKRLLTFTILLALILSTGTTAQVTQIKPYPVTPYMIDHGEVDTTMYKSTYTGLKTVGKGALVYLVSQYDADTYSWAIADMPSGSAAALDNSDTKMVTFRPDLTGEYVISLSVTGTDADGTTDSITIVAATYLGINSGNCGTCHSGTADEWEETGHSTILVRGLNGTLSSHYNEGCIECHTVGYNADVEADNGGFDDVAADLGWSFPETLQEGTYEGMDDQLKNVSNVQCESCHGPASQHGATFKAEKMDISFDSQMCGKCHDDGHYHRRPSMWKNSAHNFDPAVSAHGAGARGYCGPCHSGKQFIAEVDPESNVEFDAADAGNVGCAVCHDPHSSHDNHDPMVTGDDGTLQHHIRTLEDVTLNDGTVVTVGGTGKLCMNCHKSRRNAEEYVEDFHSHFGPHYNNQTDMVLGTNAIDFGRYLPNSTHRDVMKDFCVTCHMSETPAEGEPGRDKVGDHSFNMTWAGDDGELGTADDVHNVAKCQECHGEDITSFDSFIARDDYDGDGSIESARDELHGLMDEVGMMLPPLDDPSVDVTEDYNKLQLKAAYNYLYVEDDQSGGMHNFQYAINLLQVSLEALNYGVLTQGEILSITDVPNDQGKNVFVKWTRFGGDGTSDNPVTDYVVVRKDMNEDGSVAFNGFDEIPGDVNQFGIGDHIKDSHVTWTIVGTTKAIQFLEYQMAVPTLYDSNPTDSTEAIFKVIGVTANGMSAETAEMGGYSVDNLAPMAPANLNGSFDGSKVNLTWDEPMDEDFQYFAIYRSTEQGFDPSAMDAYTTVTANNFADTDFDGSEKLYYQISAFDFNGNESEFSGEVSATITSVNTEAGVPTNYTLSQNYPNPFNPSTTIKFGIPEQTNVKLTIYDAVGKVVDVIVNENLSAGYYNYTWNAGNMASGIYFYELRTNGFNKTSKMLLMK